MKYFLYARKSTDEDDKQLLSIDAQLAELREHAHKESLTIAREFVESRTAKIPGRPVFNAMMREVEMEEMEKKWAAENKRIMEQYPGAEAEPDTAPMEALPPPAQQEGPKEAKAVETNTQPGLPFGDEPTGGKSA